MCHHVLTESQRCHQGAFWHGLEIRRHVTIGRTSYLHHCVLCKAQSEDLPQACRVSPQKSDVFRNYRGGKKTLIYCILNLIIHSESLSDVCSFNNI